MGQVQTIYSASVRHCYGFCNVQGNLKSLCQPKIGDDLHGCVLVCMCVCLQIVSRHKLRDWLGGSW